MQPDWKNWEGEIAGEFPLEEFLGAGEQGAVFRTRLLSGEGAIKLVPARDVEAQRLTDQWNRSRALDHPHLIRILQTGTWAKANISVAYVVMEYAEENLAEVIAERPLSAGETLEMLQPVAEALAFLHRQGLVHGSLKPSNILAVKDTLKISSDAVSDGDPSGDLQDLVALMVQALTQQPPTFAKNGSARSVIDGLPEPFREIAQNCTGQGGRVPWSAAELASWLQSRGEAPAAGAATPRASQPGNPRLARNAIVFALILVAVITVGSLLRNRTVEPVSAVPQPPAKTSEPAPIASPPPASPEAGKEKPPAATPVNPATKQVTPPAPARQPQPRRVVSDSPEQVVSQVLPDITAKARRTVRGKATVVVKVAVDPSGNVTDASLERGGSRYFGKLAVDAARKWRFVAGNGDAPREWFLRFDITPRDTKVVVEKSAGR